VTGREPVVRDGSLERRLARRFRTDVSPVETSGGRFTLLHPANPEELISEDDFAQDERLPYWADVWPSSTALAGIVAALPGTGRRALELGCGVGLVAAAAARAGFAVTATDYYDDALLFARVNVWRNAGAELVVRHIDWRDLPTDLGTFDLVLASDVLYERPYAELVAAAFAQTIAPAGFGWIADPGRVAAGAFAASCEARGLSIRAAHQLPFTAGEIRQAITIHELRHS
jgi:predicted nicotinamide N-methyase